MQRAGSERPGLAHGAEVRDGTPANVSHRKWWHLLYCDDMIPKAIDEKTALHGRYGRGDCASNKE
jgi:hypothetical protein